MNILISNSSPDPIYLQIENQIKGMIIRGELEEGEMLPSMRTLSKDLKISMITTKRAYEELEKDGFLVTVAGTGCFVAPKNMDFVREAHLKDAEDAMRKACELGRICGMTLEEMKDMLTMMYEEE